MWHYDYKGEYNVKLRTKVSFGWKIVIVIVIVIIMEQKVKDICNFGLLETSESNI